MGQGASTFGNLLTLANRARYIDSGRRQSNLDARNEGRRIPVKEIQLAEDSLQFPSDRSLGKS
jgi:hypothetical protein